MTMVLFAAVTGSASARSGNGVGKLVAHDFLKPASGGLIRSPQGAALYVPPGALRRGALATITKLPRGRYDFHVGGPWTGRVAVTLPPRKRASVVLHRIGGTWVREGRPGQRTVWVSQLSLLSWAGDKLKAATCFIRNPRKAIECLKLKGVAKIESSLVKWIADLAGLDDACVRSLLASKGIVATMYTTIVGCTQKVGEGDYHYNPTAPPVQAPPPGPAPAPSPKPAPQPSPPPPPPPATYAEQQGSLGANTFLNPYNASGMGPKIPAYAVVQVSCKVYAPQIVSANPDGYWYRISSAPWNGAYYAVANTFWNGDIPGHKPYVHNTDFNVRNC